MIKPPAERDKVNEPTAMYHCMAEKWLLIHDLCEGTAQMRANSSAWLPMEPKEDSTQYKNRVNRSFLYEAYKDTVEELAGKPFSRAVSIEEQLPEQLMSIERDVDRAGTDITQLGRDMMRAGLKYGLTHLLVDFPKTSGNETLADERAKDVRPVFVHVEPPSLIGWRWVTLPNGKIDITQIRIKECRTVDVGNYADVEKEFIRVFTKTTWELYEQDNDDKDKFVKVDEGTHTFGAVPLVTFYIQPTGVLTATPPLEGLAWLNLAHFQSYSDQRNILRFARVGILFAAGFSEEELEKGIVISPSRLVGSSNPNAKLEYVEYSGGAITSGEKDLQQLEARMEVLGLQPLMENTGGATATARAIDESKSNCSLQAWVRSLENTLKAAYELAAQWVKVTLPEKFKIDIFNDFGISARSASDIDALLRMRGVGDLDRETLIAEMKRRGLLSDSTSAKDIESRLATEGPDLTDDGNTNGQ